jgi:two-component system response regulator FixJ
LKFSLEVEGFIVRVFPDANEVLGDADLPGCGCLIVDLNMPRMNGLDLVDRLRQ